MLTGWLTLTAFLAASANPERAATGRGTLTIAPTRRVKGHPEAELTLNCGDGKNAGVVQYWDLQTPASTGKPGPVFMQRDGSLTIPNTGSRHSGMYYCLLRHTEGTTLRPYELRVDSQHERSAALRSSGDVGPAEARPAGGSDGPFAGAVAASVLVTFVVGFSAGALARTPVLRCLGAVTTRLRSPRQQRCRTEVTITTLPPMYNNQAFKMTHDDDPSADCTTTETTTTPPPTKPQRSFRQKRQEAAQDTTAYLEGCDHMEEVEARGSQKERNKGCDGEAEEERGGFYLEDGGSQSTTDEDVEEKDGRESNEENEGWRQGGEVEQVKDGEKRQEEDGGERRGSAEEEKGSDQEEGKDREKRREEDGETGGSKQEEEEGGDTSSSPGRRSRVIRLYQYDEDGQRYGHLPEAADPAEPRPAPRLKQRSLSLTRLNAIMAAASAGPLDTRDTGRGEERPRFHMEI